MKPAAVLRLRSPVVAVDPLAGIPMILRLEAWKQPQADGSAVATLTDFSGNGNDLTGANVTYKTGAVAAGPAGYRFNGTNAFALSASVPAMNNTATRWYYAYYKKNGVPTTLGVVFVGENTDAPGGSGDLAYIGDGSAVNNFVGRVVSSGSSPGYADISFGGTPTGELATSVRAEGATFRVAFGGAALAQNTLSQPAPQPNGVFKFMLGAITSASPQFFLNHDLVAFFSGNTVLSAGDILVLEGYGASKYGISF